MSPINPKLLLLVSLCTVAGLTESRAEVSGSVSVEIRIGKALPPPPPEVVVVDAPAPSGPPPWAHHHWFSRERVYYYYPECDIYYRPADRMWFYLDGGEWRVGVNLPVRFEFDLNHSVRLAMATSRPYIYHQQVVTYYGRDYFRHVRIKGDHDEGPGRDQDHGHDQHAGDGDKGGQDHDKGGGKGHDKGKGHGKDK